MKNKKFGLFFYYLIIIVYLEFFFKIFTFGKLVDIGTLYSIIFAIPLALFLKLLSNFFGEKLNKVMTYIFTITIIVLFFGHFIYHKFFSTIFSLYTLGLADQAIDFISLVVSQVIKSWAQMIVMFLPLVSLIVFRKKLNFTKAKVKNKLLIILFTILTYGIGLLTLLPTKKMQYGPYEMYFLTNDPTVSTDALGLMVTARLDVKRTIFGFDDSKIYIDDSGKKIEEEKKQEYNMVNIDFESLIANTTDKTLLQMHEYFKNETPTLKSDFTGTLKGKNLVFFIAEGFNEIAVKENVTPTLYKLANNGYVFDNFYSPVFLSTTGGEYQAMNAAVVTDKGRTAWYKGDKYLPYALGNAFSSLGYNTYAFHDWTYTYYGRQKTMPEMGFSNYLACRNGLEKIMNCNQWPPSDLDMVDVTTSKFLDSGTPFVTYYFTVSGHTHYNWGGNSISAKNKALVQGLDYSETAKAYLASQIELDKALELLIQRLTEAGQLENTVIALVGDHHPYNMATGVSDTPDLTIINELSDREESKDGIIEINRSNFILWNPTIETTHITKVGSQIDVLPTILNLFGVNYDSRLLIGNDILSEAEGLAIFSNRSWITDKGKYFSSSRKFVANEGQNVDEDYVDTINKEVSNKFTMSSLLMDKDYYRKVLGE